MKITIPKKLVKRVALFSIFAIFDKLIEDSYMLIFASAFTVMSSHFILILQNNTAHS